MADEVAGSEPTVDQQLEALFKEPKPAAPAAAPGSGTPPKPGTQPAAVASPPQAEPKPGEEQKDPLLAALDEIEEEKSEEKKETPALTDEQQRVLQAVPDVQTATKLYEVVQNYSNFTTAFAGEKFDEVAGMFKSSMPGQFEAFLEWIYTKHVATGEWVDRFIAESEGRGSEHKGAKALEKKVANLEAQLNQRQQTNTETEAAQRQQKAFADYNGHVTSLFDKINFAKGDRKWVKADLDARIVANPEVITKLKAGDTKAVNVLFKAAVREYVDRNKEVDQTEEQKVAQQQQKKPPIGSAGPAAESGIPDDLDKVKPEDRDNWRDTQLAKLFGLGKKK